jgi:hypothetical protein
MQMAHAHMQSEQSEQAAVDADNIKVVVRLRPLFPQEVAKGAAEVVKVADDCSSMRVQSTDYSMHSCMHSRMHARTHVHQQAIIA